jgi:elongation factor P
MAISVTDLKNGVVFMQDGNPWQVIEYAHVKVGRGSATIKVKARNLKTGATLEKSFISGAKVDDIEVEKRNVQYLYTDGNEYFFMDQTSYEQFGVPKDQVRDQSKFFKEGDNYQASFIDEKLLGLELPRTIEVKVTQTDPGVKGDSVSNIYKDAVVETGASVKVPLFVNEGELIRVDTRSGDYLERVSTK